MPPGPSDRASRARPVADAPVAALIAASEDLAKAWLLELVAAGPLSAAPSLPLESLASEGPALCAAVARSGRRRRAGAPAARRRPRRANPPRGGAGPGA